MQPLLISKFLLHSDMLTLVVGLLVLLAVPINAGKSQTSLSHFNFMVLYVNFKLCLMDADELFYCQLDSLSLV